MGGKILILVFKHAMLWIRLSVTGPLPQRPLFYPESCDIKFVAEKVALDKDLSCRCCFKNIHFVLITLLVKGKAGQAQEAISG
jgi:hypothetical protein